jgi:hypothetical protein
MNDWQCVVRAQRYGVSFCCSAAKRREHAKGQLHLMTPQHGTVYIKRAPWLSRKDSQPLFQPSILAHLAYSATHQ